MIGIYAIFRKSDDKCMYVGQSKNVERRISEHMVYGSRFDKKYYYSKVLEEFDFYDFENQLDREAYWINELNPELNIMRDRTWPKGTHPLDGTHRTEETKQKIRETLLGNIPWNKDKTDIYSEESKQRMGVQPDNPRYEEWKKNISKAKRGTHWKVVNGKRVYYYAIIRHRTKICRNRQ